MKLDPANLDLQNAHELLVCTVVPRPIALISTIGRNGVFNLAPFGFFTAISAKPMLVALSIGSKRDGQKKNTLVNIEFSKDFVVNAVTESLADAMNQASRTYPSYVDKFREVGLTAVDADVVKAPMVAESPIKMECRLVQILKFGEEPRRTSFVIGEVIRVHVDDDLWANGGIQMTRLRAIGRLGGDLYCRTTDTFEMKRPDDYFSSLR